MMLFLIIISMDKSVLMIRQVPKYNCLLLRSIKLLLKSNYSSYCIILIASGHHNVLNSVGGNFIRNLGLITHWSCKCENNCAIAKQLTVFA